MLKAEKDIDLAVWKKEGLGVVCARLLGEPSGAEAEREETSCSGGEVETGEAKSWGVAGGGGDCLDVDFGGDGRGRGGGGDGGGGGGMATDLRGTHTPPVLEGGEAEGGGGGGKGGG